MSGWRELEGLWDDRSREPTDSQFGGVCAHQEHITPAAAYVDFIRDLPRCEQIDNPNWLLAQVALGLPQLADPSIPPEGSTAGLYRVMLSVGTDDERRR